jgi:hypothetical protein
LLDLKDCLPANKVRGQDSGQGGIAGADQPGVDGQGFDEIDGVQGMNVIEPDMVAHHEGRQPCQADDDDVAASAIPQIERMAGGDPWHAERIGPVI